jgi:hypothetical protein
MSNAKYHEALCCCAECHYTECGNVSVVKHNVVVPSNIMLSVIIPSVAMLSVVMVNAMAPNSHTYS